MKVIQMQYSPDAFDSFIKQKLDDVEVDTTAASQHWKQMPHNSGRRERGFNSQLLYSIFDIIIFTSLIMFIYIGNKTADSSLPISNTEGKNINNLQGVKNNIEQPTPVPLQGSNCDVVTKNKANTTGPIKERTTNEYDTKVEKENFLNNRLIENRLNKVSVISNPEKKDSTFLTSLDDEKVQQQATISNATRKDGIAPDTIVQKKAIKPLADQQKKKSGPAIIW